MPSIHSPRLSAPIVLLVDEDVLVRLSIAEYLRACGFAVREAANVAEAKAVLLTDEHVDYVLSDAQLSGEGGFAFTQWVRRLRPNATPIMTATVAGKAKAAAQLCDDHAPKPKPCEHGRLSDRIQALVAKRARKSKTPRMMLRALRA